MWDRKRIRGYKKKRLFLLASAIGALDGGFSTIALGFGVKPFHFSLQWTTTRRGGWAALLRGGAWVLLWFCEHRPLYIKLIKKFERDRMGRGEGGGGVFAMNPWISFEEEAPTSEGNEIVITKFPKAERGERKHMRGELLSDVTFL